MGLAASRPVIPEDGYTIAYYSPQPQAVIEVVDFDDTNSVVPYGGTGRVKLTTLTKETFVLVFLNVMKVSENDHMRSIHGTA